MTQTAPAGQTQTEPTTSTRPQRVHWYDGADLSDLPRLTDLIISGQPTTPMQPYESRISDDTLRNMSANALKQSPEVAGIIHQIFSRFCSASCYEKLRSTTSTGIARNLLREGRVNPDFWLDPNGTTPLMAANTFAAVEELLKHGANPNAQDDKGRTPLMFQRGRYELSSLPTRSLEYITIINALVIHPKTDVNLCDKNGFTALGYGPSGLIKDMIAHEMKKSALAKAFTACASALAQRTGERWDVAARLTEEEKQAIPPDLLVALEAHC